MWVAPGWQGTGIGTTLLTTTDRRWTINFPQQSYTTDGLRFVQRYLTRGRRFVEPLPDHSRTTTLWRNGRAMCRPDGGKEQPVQLGSFGRPGRSEPLRCTVAGPVGVVLRWHWIPQNLWANTTGFVGLVSGGSRTGAKLPAAGCPLSVGDAVPMRLGQARRIQQRNRCPEGVGIGRRRRRAFPAGPPCCSSPRSDIHVEPGRTRGAARH